MSLDSSSNMSLPNAVSIGTGLQPIVKLDPSGSNWLVYKRQSEASFGARVIGGMRHIDGRARVPADLTWKEGPSADEPGAYIKADKTSPTEDEIAVFERKMDEYQQREDILKQQMLATVYPTLAFELDGKATAKAMWDHIKGTFEKKSDLHAFDLRHKMASLRCAKEGNVREHIASMNKAREELAGMGHPIPDAEFAATITASLPDSYRPTLTSVITTARLNDRTLAASDLIEIVCEEYDHQVIVNSRDKEASDHALAAKTNAKGSNGKGHGRNGKSKIKCYNCNKMGHMKADCYAKGGGKEGQGPRQQAKAESANAATTNSNYAFHVMSTEAAYASSQAAKGALDFVVDMGATRHFSAERDKFVTFKEITPIPVYTADGKTFNAVAKGDLVVTLPNGGSGTQTTLKDTYYAPSMPTTLISVSRLDAGGCSLKVKDGKCKIWAPDGKRIGLIDQVNGLYQFDTNGKAREHAMAAKLNVSLTELHELMGHVSMDAAKSLVEQNAVVGIKLRDQTPTFCEACVHAKQQKKAIPDQRTSPRSSSYGDLIHTDVWGPARVSTLRGKQYFISFTDDYSRETRVTFLKKKSEAFEAYKHYEAWVKAQRTGNDRAATIKTLQSDRGGEYTSGEFSSYLKAQGTTRKLTTHDTPEQNGVSERKNRTLVEHARAMLYAAGLPGSLWAEAVNHATWLANRTVSRSLPTGKTAHEMATNAKPILSDLHTWGCKAYVLVPGGRNWTPRSKKVDLSDSTNSLSPDIESTGKICQVLRLNVMLDSIVKKL